MNANRLMRRHGFTLIELLVVIAIIAILAAILFPVFAQAREKARQTQCVSNEKQISMAIISYSQDFDECFPMAYWWTNYDWNLPDGMGWTLSVKPYIKNLGVWACPSDGMGLKPAPDSSGWCGVFLDFVGNSFHAGWNGSANIAMGPIGYNGASWMEEAPVSQAKMTRVADTILLAEKFGSDTGTNYPGANCSRGCPTGDVITGDMGDFAQNIPDGTRPDAPYPNGKNGGVSAHHSNKADFAFVDGHVKTLDPVKTNPDPTNRWDLNMWDGTRQ